MPAGYDISSIDEVFSIWPSLAEMARDLGVKYYTVTKWWQRKRIPPESWNAVVAAAKRKGSRVSPALLNRLNAPRGTANQVGVVG